MNLSVAVGEPAFSVLIRGQGCLVGCLAGQPVVCLAVRAVAGQTDLSGQAIWRRLDDGGGFADPVHP